MEGLAPMLVSVWFTVTTTLLVAELPPLSVIVAVRTYVPAFLKVTVVFLAALLPLAV